MGPLPYSWPSVVLVAVQAGLVALPAAGLPGGLRRFSGRAWSLVLPLSIVVVVGGLAALPGAARGLTWLALLAIPLLAAAALGWAMHRARPVFALLAVALLVVALVVPVEARGGQLVALTLTALSCVTLGRLLVGVVGGTRDPAQTPCRTMPSPLTWVRVGLVAMAVIDAVLVFSGALEGPNATLNAAAPTADLPRLQFLTLDGASLGYGDVFVAAVLGAVLAAEGARRRTQLAAAAVTLVLSLLFDLLFAFDSIQTLPATVPVAVATLLFGGWRGPVSGGWRRRGSPGPAGSTRP